MKRTLIGAVVTVPILFGVASAALSQVSPKPPSSPPSSSAPVSPSSSVTDGRKAPAAPAPAAATAIDPMQDQIEVPVWPVEVLALPSPDPAQASFTFGQIEGIDPKLLEGVTVRGFARKVDVQDKSVGQILLQSVAKGDREEVISEQGFTSQFDAKKMPELQRQEKLDAKGSRAELIAALQRLQGEKDDKEKAGKDTSRTSDSKVGSGSSSSTTSGTGRYNDEAAGYRSPTAGNNTSTSKTTETTIVVKSSTEGCKIRVDEAQGKAIQQSKEQTFTNGSLTEETACSDSEVSYPLVRSYLTCSDLYGWERGKPDRFRVPQGR